MVRLVRPHQRRATARRNARGECGAAERSNTALGISTRERGPTAPSPVALGDPDRVLSFLGVSGFTDVELEGVQQPMYFTVRARSSRGSWAQAVSAAAVSGSTRTPSTRSRRDV
jgi:hypothetical protein